MKQTINCWGFKILTVDCRSSLYWRYAISVIAPERLHSIMTSCWSQMPDSRPTFKRCVKEIENLKEETETESELGDGGYIRYEPGPGQSSAGASCVSHYHSATTASVASPDPAYLELVRRSGDSVNSSNSSNITEYETPRHSHNASNSGCSCSQTQHQHGKVKINWGKLWLKHSFSAFKYENFGSWKCWKAEDI